MLLRQPFFYAFELNLSNSGLAKTRTLLVALSLACLEMSFVGPGSLEASRDDKRIICILLQSVGFSGKSLGELV